VVGLMLVSFGTFWAGEGLGLKWPGSDLAIPVLVGVYAVVTWLLVQALRPSVARLQPEQAHAG
jgi:Ca2+/H+ antiporter, TMEM165/GDT1 family